MTSPGGIDPSVPPSPSCPGPVMVASESVELMLDPRREELLEEWDGSWSVVVVVPFAVVVVVMVTYRRGDGRVLVLDAVVTERILLTSLAGPNWG